MSRPVTAISSHPAPSLKVCFVADCGGAGCDKAVTLTRQLPDLRRNMPTPPGCATGRGRAARRNLAVQRDRARHAGNEQIGELHVAGHPNPDVDRLADRRVERLTQFQQLHDRLARTGRRPPAPRVAPDTAACWAAACEAATEACLAASRAAASTALCAVETRPAAMTSPISIKISGATSISSSGALPRSPRPIQTRIDQPGERRLKRRNFFFLYLERFSPGFRSLPS